MKCSLSANGKTPTGPLSHCITSTHKHIHMRLCGCHALSGVCQCTDEHVQKHVSVGEKLFVLKGVQFEDNN